MSLPAIAITMGDAAGVGPVGGQLRQVGLGFVGPHAERAMRRISASKVFLGTDGVVAGRGICEATDAQASLKELMVRQAEQVFVLADAKKLGRAASAAWTPLDRHGRWSRMPALWKCSFSRFANSGM